MIAGVRTLQATITIQFLHCVRIQAAVTPLTRHRIRQHGRAGESVPEAQSLPFDHLPHRNAAASL